MNRELKQSVYPSMAVAGFSEVDGTVLFYNFIHSRLEPGCVVLDFGAGRGYASEDGIEWRRRLAAMDLYQVRRIAVDVDPAVLENPLAVERYLMPIDDGKVRIPLDDNSVDAIVCDWVVEHLPNPEETFAEFVRVLRPGGMAAVRTSNQWHYAYLIARLAGNTSLGEWLLRRAQPGRKDEDVFPKLYRANTRLALRRSLARVGFESPAVFTWDTEPAYVGNSWVAGVIGFVYHRLAMAGILPRACLYGFAVKPGGGRSYDGAPGGNGRGQ